MIHIPTSKILHVSINDKSACGQRAKFAFNLHAEPGGEYRECRKCKRVVAR